MTLDPQAFRFDGGATWLNLLATRGRAFSANPVERLDSPRQLAQWLAAVDLAPERPPTEGDVRAAHELRESLRELAMASTGGTAPPPAALQHLREHLTQARPIRLSVQAGRLQQDPPAVVREALTRIAQEAAEHLTGPGREHLRECAESDCRWVFADPRGRRHWCPSPACASRGRVRAHRARRSTQAP